MNVSIKKRQEAKNIINGKNDDRNYRDNQFKKLMKSPVSRYQPGQEIPGTKGTKVLIAATKDNKAFETMKRHEQKNTPKQNKRKPQGNS